jgi:two-component system response regulator AtoC
VFLDEIGELALATQVKLLRLLEERAVTRIGSTRSRPIDVRFVAATNRDLEADSREGRFRPDLYFRLSGVTLVLPPLRERPREIEVLAVQFLTAACRDLERSAPLAISPATLDRLRGHTWPGNVRELRNVIERAAVMCTDSVILPEHLPASLLAPIKADATTTSSSSQRREGQPPNHHDEMRSLERTKILDALERCDGNQSEAARQLGMPRRTLVSRLSELGLTRRRPPVGES